MGKLGGQELNVASDIDLIFAHDSDTWKINKAQNLQKNYLCTRE